MTRTTPPPRFDLAALIPALAPLARVTVRLHPRPGPEPPANASKLGGHILWPADEPWPRCTEPEWDRSELDAMYPQWQREPPNAPPHEHAYIPILQLRRDDLPELGFPGDTDLFQLLWCPNDHEIFLSPVCKIYWRREADVRETSAVMPAPAPIEQDYVPRPCQLHPERVVEYPREDDLPEVVDTMIAEWERANDQEGQYFYELSTAPGTKVGGSPSWIQGDSTPRCDCEQPMEHLLTIASGEFLSLDWERWCPIEDKAATGLLPEELQANNAYLYALQAADRSTGLMLGDGGRLYLFICRRCTGWPIWWVMQSS